MEVYILIQPGFGIISMIVSRFSQKSVFGQVWPLVFFIEYPFYLFSKNTTQCAICREVELSKLSNLTKLLDINLQTTNISVVINYRLLVTPYYVKMLINSINPQITNVRILKFKNLIILSFKFILKKIKINFYFRKSSVITFVNIRKLSILVGISEAICTLLIFHFMFQGLDASYYLSLISCSFLPFFTIILIYVCLTSLRTGRIANKQFFKTPYVRKTNTGICYNSILSQNYEANNPATENDKIFNQWLAGLIDGDGCFLLSKKGYASLEITMDIRDKRAQFLIKQKFGGSVKLRSGSNSMRYRQHNKEGLIKLINSINGEIRNSIRILQLVAICEKYNINFIFPLPLTYYNGWFSGFFDADGSVYKSPDQIIISACNNIKNQLDDILSLYGGSINHTNTSGRSFKWQISKKKDIITQQDYFNKCPSRSAKFNRINLIPKFYELREKKAHLASITSINGKIWSRFLDKWNKGGEKK